MASDTGLSSRAAVAPAMAARNKWDGRAVHEKLGHLLVRGRFCSGSGGDRKKQALDTEECLDIGIGGASIKSGFLRWRIVVKVMKWSNMLCIAS